MIKPLVVVAEVVDEELFVLLRLFFGYPLVDDFVGVTVVDGVVGTGVEGGAEEGFGLLALGERVERFDDAFCLCCFLLVAEDGVGDE